MWYKDEVEPSYNRLYLYQLLCQNREGSRPISDILGDLNSLVEKQKDSLKAHEYSMKVIDRFNNYEAEVDLREDFGNSGHTDVGPNFKWW